MTEGKLPSAGANRFLTASNCLSIFRAILSIPFALVMLSDLPDARGWGIAMLVVAALTDKLDGVIARKFNQITEWGQILDPLADKVGVAVLALVLLYLGSIPVWFVVVLLLRDLLIFAGGLFLKAKRGIVLPSNEVGKWAVGVITLTLFLALVGVSNWVFQLLIWVTVLMLAVSLGLYVKRFGEVMGGVGKYAESS